MGAQVTPVLENVHIDVGFSTPFCYRVRSPYRQTDRRTDRRTGKTRNVSYQKGRRRRKSFH